MSRSARPPGRPRRPPVLAIVLAAVLLAACGRAPDDEPAARPTAGSTPAGPTPDPTNPSPRSTPDPTATDGHTTDDRPDIVAGPATTERTVHEPDGSVVLTDITIDAHGSFDRLVLEVTGNGEAGWLIEYDDDPRSQGRGDPVEIEGDAVLRVALRRVPYPAAAPVETYDGPRRIRPERTDAVVEVLHDVLFEGYQDVFVGLDQRRPYRVERRVDPQRVVIDIETD